MNAPRPIDFSGLHAIVGPEWFGPTTTDVAGVTVHQSVTPASGDEVARVLAWANEHHVAVIPTGGSTKLDWGTPPRRADLLMQTHRLNRVVEHAWGDMTATLEAGCTIATAQHILAEHGQRLAIDPLWPATATIGGVLATNDNGARRLRFGGLRDQVLGMTIALADGTLAKSGGKVVKNVAGYDLQKLMTGAYGTLGVIIAATLRVFPLPKENHVLRFAPATTSDLDRLVGGTLHSTLTPVSLTVQGGTDASLTVEIVFEGLAEALKAQEERLRSIAANLPMADEQPLAPREAFFATSPEAQAHSLTARFSLLPGDIGSWLDQVQASAATEGLAWNLEVQGTGTGHLQLQGQADALARSFTELRTTTQRQRGSLVALAVPPPLRDTLDVWGADDGSWSLMRRVKAQFDPDAILNPGRFIGGI